MRSAQNPASSHLLMVGVTPGRGLSFLVENLQMNPRSISKGLLQTKAVPRPSGTNRFPLDSVEILNRSHSHTLCYLGLS